MATSRRGLFATGAATLIATTGAAAGDDLVGTEYTAEKRRGGEIIRLALYRRRIGNDPRPVLFLVHGSSFAARAAFDLTVHSPGDYALMDVFARNGFDVWSMDCEGYGKSSQTSGNSDIASGVEDLRAAAAVVLRETGQARMHLAGESSGALRAAAFAAAEPERAGRLVLMAYTYTGRGSPTLTKRAEGVDYFRTHNRRPRDIEMLRSVFTRDKPGTSDPAVPEAMAKIELAFVNGDSVPTGTYLDMTTALPIVDPARVHSPVLLMRGEYDGIATVDDLVDFYTKLPNGDRQLVIIPGAAHSIALSLNRALMWHVMNAFLTMPAPVKV